MLIVISEKTIKGEALSDLSQPERYIVREKTQKAI